MSSPIQWPGTIERTDPDPVAPQQPKKSRMASVFDFTYFRSVSFILKFFIIIMEIGGAISVSVMYSHWAASGYYNFVAVTGIVVALVMIILNFCQIPKKLDNLPWNFGELIFDALWAILMLIAAAIVTDSARKFADMQSYAAAAFFGFAALLLYIIDALIRLASLLRGNHKNTKGAGQPS